MFVIHRRGAEGAEYFGIGENVMSILRSIREKKGFTLGQLAGRAGISTRVLADYEEGRQVMALAHAKLLAKALWVGIEELIPPPGAEKSASTTQTNSMADAATTSHGASAQSIISEPHIPAATHLEEATRPTPYMGIDQHRKPGAQGANEQRPQRAPRVAAAPTMPITEGQHQELAHLAARLQIDDAQLEERVGMRVGDLKRIEAKEWIKRLRGMADEVAPGAKVRYGQWPEAEKDREAVYLQEQKEAQAQILFKLFNGETFTGIISDFSPYTIIVKQDEEDVVLRKLAIAYYRRLAPGEEKKMGERPKQGENEEASGPSVHNHNRDDKHQPLDKGIDSDLTGTPDTPEEDNMDEDRGA